MIFAKIAEYRPISPLFSCVVPVFFQRSRALGG
jgi:hypothetical protein